MMFRNRRGVLASSLVLAVNTVCGVSLVLANLLYYGPSDEVASAPGSAAFEIMAAAVNR